MTNTVQIECKIESYEFLKFIYMIHIFVSFKLVCQFESGDIFDDKREIYYVGETYQDLSKMSHLLFVD